MGVFGGAEEEFPMVCNRKGHCGEMRAWGTWCNMEEIGGDMELKDNTALRLQQTQPHSSGNS